MDSGSTHQHPVEGGGIPPPPPRDDTKKKLNPLVDLIETEKNYVDLLAGIIRKVASAWSRANFPPVELDGMFRAVETVYRANRSLLAKLKEIGPNPSSPKALGDLLMRWIDDLEPPYSRYCSVYVTSFDTWDPVQSNPNLPGILDALTATLPLPPSLSAWTLDALFQAPMTRLKYYKKLYARLLKSTQPGRSDHKLLVGANERLVGLLGTIEARSSIRVGDQPTDPQSNEAIPSHPGTVPQPPPPERARSDEIHSPQRVTSPPSSFRDNRQYDQGVLGQGSRASDRESTTESNSSGRFSRESIPTSATSKTGRSPSASSLAALAVDLERRLSVERVLDIFTMSPKKCKLQMAPPNLPYTRTIRGSADVVIYFTPRSTGQEVIHRQGCIFLLTDLFLICERMSDEERTVVGPDGPDMWLCYPPLSGKHLRTVDAGDNVFQITIMKKETLTVHTESKHVKDALIRDFAECLDLASSFGPPRLNTPAPPLPRLPTDFPLSAPPHSRPTDPTFPSQLPPQGLATAHPDIPPRSRTQSPPAQYHPGPNHAFAVTESNDSLNAPKAQFGRLTVGSDLNLPASGSMPFLSGPPGSDPGNSRGATPDTTLFIPPPRGASRGAMPLSPAGPPTSQFPQRQQSLTAVHDSSRSLTSQHPNSDEFDHLGRMPSTPRDFSQMDQRPPPRPPNSEQQFGPGPNGYPPQNGRGPQSIHSSDSASLQTPSREPSMVSFASRPSRLQTGYSSRAPSPDLEDSPPTSPDEPTHPTGPVTSTITAQMKCKVFLQQQHAQWKSIGSARLLLYDQQPTNVKQLVVNAENKAKTPLISTIVLSDGVERVGKTGVAIELSDKGSRTGIVYMIQLKSETSASGFFASLVAGSDRAVAVRG